MTSVATDVVSMLVCIQPYLGSQGVNLIFHHVCDLATILTLTDIFSLKNDRQLVLYFELHQYQLGILPAGGDNDDHKKNKIWQSYYRQREFLQ